MEELNETMDVEIIENDEEFENENSGVGGKIALSIAALGLAGAAVAAFAAKKSGKLGEIKEARRQKKIEKTEAKLEKLYTEIKSEAEEKSDEEEE